MNTTASTLELVPAPAPADQIQPEQIPQDYNDLPEVLKPDFARVSQVVIKASRDLIATRIIGVISRDFNYLDEENIRRSFCKNFFTVEYNPLLIFLGGYSAVSYQKSAYPQSVIARLGYQPLPVEFDKIYKIENPDGLSYELESDESGLAIVNKFQNGQLVSVITLHKGKHVSETNL